VAAALDLHSGCFHKQSVKLFLLVLLVSYGIEFTQFFRQW